MSGRGPSQATRLVDLAADLELWHSDGEPFATVRVGDHCEHWPTNSKTFRRYLARAFYASHGASPNAEAITSALAVLEGRGLHDGEQHATHVRVAPDQDGFFLYLDLANDRWEAVEIDCTGWRIIPAHECPARFRRAPGMLALPTPERGGSIENLRHFINVSTEDDWILFVGWILGAMRGRGPYLVLILQGEQGSAKSTTARVARRLLDPNKAELRAQPREPRDLAVGCNNARCVALDNLSSVYPWLSDALCRVATGGGFATRALYTNSEEAIFEAQRPIILNGIDSVAERGDLLDRALLLTLPRLRKVRTEDELWRAFEAARPRLLGALLDAVSVALRREREVDLSVSVRMADAARWVVASEPALPWSPRAFLAAYAANRGDANEVVIEASPVAGELARMMGMTMCWEGTAGELLAALAQRAPEKIQKLKAWPTTPRQLASDLRRVAPNLRGIGIEIEFPGPKGHSRRRMILISAAPGSDRPHRPHKGASGADPEACVPRNASDRADDQCEPLADRPQVSGRECNGNTNANGADDGIRAASAGSQIAPLAPGPIRDDWERLAARLECEGGLPSEQAERQAAEELGLLGGTGRDAGGRPS